MDRILTLQIGQRQKMDVNILTACLFNARLYLTPMWQARQFKPVVPKIPSIGGNLFAFVISA
jgi:hypothetical protein